MTRLLALAALLVATALGLAAQPPGPPAVRFKWQAGQSLTYKVTQQTAVVETALDEKTEKPITTEARTNLTLVRKWTIKDVDPAGIATLEMLIPEMKNEIRQPDGNTLVRDSANPEHAKEMAEYLNKPILTIRVDTLGRIVEVKESKGGSVARLHAELPFRMVLPEAGPSVGQSWDRPFAFKLDPPHGTGESYDFTQKFTCKDSKDGLIVIGVETALKAPTKSAGEQIPLVPLLWTGEVYFNHAAGRYHAARLKAKTELPNHVGAGSKFVYESTYSEDTTEK